jgi:hypothetical protein
MVTGESVAVGVASGVRVGVGSSAAFPSGLCASRFPESLVAVFVTMCGVEAEAAGAEKRHAPPKTPGPEQQAEASNRISLSASFPPMKTIPAASRSLLPETAASWRVLWHDRYRDVHREAAESPIYGGSLEVFPKI